MAKSRAVALSRSVPAVRRSPAKSLKLVKAQERLANIGKRARQEASKSENALISVGAAFGFAMLQKRVKVPTIMGVDPKLVYGLVLAIGGPRLMAGKNGQRLEAAGTGLLAAAAASAATLGTVKVGEDDDYDDSDDEG